MVSEIFKLARIAHGVLLLGGGSICSNDDVINSMTSLLLPYFAHNVGGQLTPLTPLRLPPWIHLCFINCRSGGGIMF